MRCGFLLPRGSRKPREPLVDVGLLVAVQPAGHASPEDPPVDFALHLVAVGQAAGVDAARLLDAEIVARDSRSRGAGRSRTDSASGSRTPGSSCARRPRPGTRRPSGGWRRAARLFLPSPMVCSSLAGSFLGRDGRFRGGREHRLDQLQRRLQRLLADHRRGLALHGLRPPPACAARTAGASGCR